MISWNPGIQYPKQKTSFRDLFSSGIIPSPLDYSGKRRKQFIRDVVELKGDFYYRSAVIDTLTDLEAGKLLDKMENYENSLKKGKTGIQYLL